MNFSIHAGPGQLGPSGQSGTMYSKAEVFSQPLPANLTLFERSSPEWQFCLLSDRLSSASDGGTIVYIGKEPVSATLTANLSFTSSDALHPYSFGIYVGRDAVPSSLSAVSNRGSETCAVSMSASAIVNPNDSIGLGGRSLASTDSSIDVVSAAVTVVLHP